MKQQELFISYSGSDGLSFAQDLYDTLVNDFTLWLYKNHRELGESTWRDIATHLIQSDGMILINTSCSVSSRGQKLECGIALNNGKRIYTLKHDKSEILPELSWQNSSIEEWSLSLHKEASGKAKQY